MRRWVAVFFLVFVIIEGVVWAYILMFLSGPSRATNSMTAEFFVICGTPLVAIVSAFFSTIYVECRKKQPVPGHCVCGYNLIGNESGTCPECGRRVKTQPPLDDDVVNRVQPIAADYLVEPEEPPEDDTSEPTNCLSYGAAIVAGARTCSACGWSYKPDA